MRKWTPIHITAVFSSKFGKNSSLIEAHIYSMFIYNYILHILPIIESCVFHIVVSTISVILSYRTEFCLFRNRFRNTEPIENFKFLAFSFCFSSMDSSSVLRFSRLILDFVKPSAGHPWQVAPSSTSSPVITNVCSSKHVSLPITAPLSSRDPVRRTLRSPTTSGLRSKVPLELM